MKLHLDPKTSNKGFFAMPTSLMKRILWILFVALVARLVAYTVMPEPHMPYNAIFAYVKGAQLIVEGQGFSDVSFPVYTPPLYSLIIAAMTVLFGDGILAIKLLQIATDSFTAVLVYLLIRKIFEESTGFLTGMMWALYPFTIYSTIYIGTEVFFTFFIALFLLLLVYGIHGDSWYFHCAAGIVLGMATLVRGTTQFIPLVLPFVLFALRGKCVHWLRNYSLSLICFLIVILPWGLRNYIVLHEIIPVGANSTVILYGTSEPLLTIGTRQQALDKLFAQARTKGIVPPGEDRGPAERDSYLTKVAIETYRDRLMSAPLDLSIFMFHKFFRLWYSTESGSNHGITLGINGGVYILSLIGILATWKKKSRMAMVLLGLVGYFVLLHWVTLPLFRYMLPVMPYIMAFAAYGLLLILERWSPKTYRRFQVMTR